MLLCVVDGPGHEAQGYLRLQVELYGYDQAISPDFTKTENAFNQILQIYRKTKKI